MISDGNLSLLHCLKKSCLNLGRRSVDLISENEICENRAKFCFKGALLRVIDHRAEKISGKKVWSKLDASKLSLKSSGESLDRESLGKARNPF